MVTKKKYKTIIYQNHSEISLFELNFFDNKIKEPKDFILKLSDFSELIGHQKPKFILFNKYTENIEIETLLRDFIPRFIYETIFDFGVKKIFFLSKNQYKVASKITKGENIIVFENISEIYDYIAKKQELNC